MLETNKLKRDRQSLFRKKENFINFFISEKCNFNCKYCRRKKKKRDALMNEDIACKALDLFLPNGKNHLSIAGGEPFLNYSLLKKIAYYSTRKYLNKIKYGLLTINIFTNGIFLTEEKFDSLTSFNVSVNRKDFVNIAVSFDGSPFIHNKNRKNAKEVEENIRKIKNYYLRLTDKEKYFRRLDCLWTITHSTIGHLFEGIRYLFEILKIQDFMHGLAINFAFLYDWPQLNSAKIKEIQIQTKKVMSYLYGKNILERFNIGPITAYYLSGSNHILYSDPCRNLPASRCGRRNFSILANGDILRCNCQYVADYFKDLFPLLLGNVKDADSTKMDEIIAKQDFLDKLVLKDLEPYLNSPKQLKNYSSFVLNNVNRVCYLCYKNERSIYNNYLAQKTFFEAILLFLKNNIRKRSLPKNKFPLN